MARLGSRSFTLVRSTDCPCRGTSAAAKVLAGLPGGMASVLATTSSDCAQLGAAAQAASAAQRKVQKMEGDLSMDDDRKGVASSRDILRSTAVLGKTVGASPDYEELCKYVEKATGHKPLQLQILKDDSFMVIMKEATAAQVLVDTRETYQELCHVHLEAWTPQKQVDRIVFEKRLVWVQLVDLRPDCIGIAAYMAARLGTVCTYAPNRKSSMREGLFQNF